MFGMGGRRSFGYCMFRLGGIFGSWGNRICFVRRRFCLLKRIFGFQGILLVLCFLIYFLGLLCRIFLFYIGLNFFYVCCLMMKRNFLNIFFFWNYLILNRLSVCFQWIIFYIGFFLEVITENKNCLFDRKSILYIFFCICYFFFSIFWALNRMDWNLFLLEKMVLNFWMFLVDSHEVV